MDFMKLIESLDEALYTVMSWLVFYPATLWRTIVRPLEMMAYSDREMTDNPKRQYDDAIRPPLFLFLTLLLSHGLEIAMTGQNPLIASRHGLAVLVDSDLALLGLRLVLFSLFTLAMAVRLLQRQHLRLTHSNLRRPFYGQCYTAAPFALLLGVGTLIARATDSRLQVAGLAVMAAAVVWYLGVETWWFSRKLGISLVAAFGDALLATVVSIALFIAAALVTT